MTHRSQVSAVPWGAVIHHLHAGIAACRMPEVPGMWPVGHLWSSYWGDVNCLACLGARGFGPRSDPTKQPDLTELHEPIERCSCDESLHLRAALELIMETCIEASREPTAISDRVALGQITSIINQAVFLTRWHP